MKIQNLDRYVVDPVTGCHRWTGRKSLDGYGRSSKFEAHRLAYVASKGPIPEGLQIDHLCRVRDCVNPEHLEAVEKRVNVLRGTSFSAVNAAKTECDQGHQFDFANTYVRPDGTRDCRACGRERQRLCKARKAA